MEKLSVVAGVPSRRDDTPEKDRLQIVQLICAKTLALVESLQARGERRPVDPPRLYPEIARQDKFLDCMWEPWLDALRDLLHRVPQEHHPSLHPPGTVRRTSPGARITNLLQPKIISEPTHL